MVTELNNQNLGANKPDSMFCSFLEHRKLSLRLSDGACHFSESPCNPCSAGTTLDVVLSFLFNLTWLVPPWRMTWEKYNLSNLALAVFSTPLAVCVCVSEGPGPGCPSLGCGLKRWMQDPKEMNARSKHIEVVGFNDEGACCLLVRHISGSLSSEQQAGSWLTF